MDVFDVENYDGEKGYVKNVRYEVLELEKTRYLVDKEDSLIQANGKLLESVVDQSSRFRVYKIISQDIENSTATAEGVRDKGILVGLAKVLENEHDNFFMEED